MEPNLFIKQLDQPRIIAAIAAAERKSSGELRIFVAHHEVGNPLEAAERQFLKLGMDRTRERNAVLIFFAPLSQKFAVVGDRGVHEKCGETFWQEVAEDMRGSLKNGFCTDAVIGAIEKIGALLSRHFPPRPDDKNELPDEISGD